MAGANDVCNFLWQVQMMCILSCGRCKWCVHFHVAGANDVSTFVWQVDPVCLAEAGFVYTGPQDRVQCVHCEGSLRNWQGGDIPSQEHARHFPTCPMILGSQTSAPAPAVGPSISYTERARHTPPPSSASAAGISS